MHAGYKQPPHAVGTNYTSELPISVQKIKTLKRYAPLNLAIYTSK